MGYDGMNVWAGGMGFGWTDVLFWIVLILALTALIKYVVRSAHQSPDLPNRYR